MGCGNQGELQNAKQQARGGSQAVQKEHRLLTELLSNPMGGLAWYADLFETF